MIHKEVGQSGLMDYQGDGVLRTQCNTLKRSRILSPWMTDRLGNPKEYCILVCTFSYGIYLGTLYSVGGWGFASHDLLCMYTVCVRFPNTSGRYSVRSIYLEFVFRFFLLPALSLTTASSTVIGLIGLKTFLPNKTGRGILPYLHLKSQERLRIIQPHRSL